LILCRLAVKVAVTLLPSSKTVQLLPAAVQPVQPPKPKLLFAGVAVSTTLGWPVKFAEQVPGQLMPAGELVTVPLPAPSTVTVSWETPLTRPWHPPSAITSTAQAVLANNLQVIEERFFKQRLG
jgi:hypothetical protein